MAKIAIGTLSTFNHEVQEWILYKGRLEQWFLANELGITEEKSHCKRRAILLSSLSENTYKLVRDLALPSDVGTLYYEDVVKLLDSHFQTKTCGFAERYKFFTATQNQNEVLAEWAARVRGLTLYCDFSHANLNEALRDRFVLGMVLGPECDKLFTVKMSELTLSKASDIAEGIHCARLGAATVGPAMLADAMGALLVLKMAAMSTSRSQPDCSGAGYGRRQSQSDASEQVLAQRRGSSGCSICGYKSYEKNTCMYLRLLCEAEYCYELEDSAVDVV